MFKIIYNREFSGSSVIRAQCFHCRGLGLIRGQENKIPQAHTM